MRDGNAFQILTSQTKLASRVEQQGDSASLIPFTRQFAFSNSTFTFKSNLLQKDQKSRPVCFKY